MMVTMADSTNFEDWTRPELVPFLTAHRHDRELTRRTAAYRQAVQRTLRLQDEGNAAVAASADPDSDPVAIAAFERLLGSFQDIALRHLHWLARVAILADSARDQRAYQAAWWLARRRYGDDVNLIDPARYQAVAERWGAMVRAAILGNAQDAA